MFEQCAAIALFAALVLLTDSPRCLPAEEEIAARSKQRTARQEAAEDSVPS